MVTLTGTVSKHTDIDALIHAVHQTAGVVAIQQQLTFSNGNKPDAIDDMIGAVHPPIV
ncbi:MAG TPA: hypothetical protein VFU36_01950 [Jatrophihabitans sp.]|nr:hypothetical protein [Jatrophihabitans sp.]